MILMNKILILIILIFLINHLSDGQISKIFKNTFNTCKINVENFMGLTYEPSQKTSLQNIPYQSQKDFPYNNHNDELDDETYGLYKFLNNLVTVNVNIYELTPNDSDRIKVSDKLKEEIYDELNKKFRCSEYRFDNITFLSDLYYYKNYTGKSIEPFEFKSNIIYKKKSIGTVIIYIECFIRDDKFSDFLTIQSIKLINRTYSDKVWRSAYKLIPTKNENSNKDSHKYNTYILENNIQQNKMVESFTNHFVNRENYNDLFIKPPTHNQNSLQSDTENSLIPSNIEFSACM
jgi:hypothetical protein